MLNSWDVSSSAICTRVAARELGVESVDCGPQCWVRVLPQHACLYNSGNGAACLLGLWGSQVCYTSTGCRDSAGMQRAQSSRGAVLLWRCSPGLLRCLLWFTGMCRVLALHSNPSPSFVVCALRLLPHRRKLFKLPWGILFYFFHLFLLVGG